MRFAVNSTTPQLPTPNELPISKPQNPQKRNPQGENSQGELSQGENSQGENSQGKTRLPERPAFVPWAFWKLFVASSLGVGRWVVGNCLRVHPVEHARVGDRLPQVFESANPADDALDAHAEAAVRDGAVAAQVEIPLEGFVRRVVLLDALQEQIEVGQTLAAADNLAVTLRREHVDAERD